MSLIKQLVWQAGVQKCAWGRSAGWGGGSLNTGQQQGRLLGLLGDNRCHLYLVPTSTPVDCVAPGQPVCLSQTWEQVWSVQECAPVPRGGGACAREPERGVCRDPERRRCRLGQGHRAPDRSVSTVARTQPLCRAPRDPATPDRRPRARARSPLLPQGAGPGREQEATGTSSSGAGGLLGRSVESPGRKVGTAEMRDSAAPSGRGAPLAGLGGAAVPQRPLAAPPRAAATSRSRPPPRGGGGGGAFPLCGPGAPGPAPGPLPPGRSLPVGGGGGGVRALGSGLRRAAAPSRASTPGPARPPSRGPPAPSGRGRRSPAADGLSPARSGRAAPAPRTNHSQATAGRAGPRRPAPTCRRLRGRGQHGGLRPRGAQRGHCESLPRPGPARLRSARRRLSPLARPPPRPPLPPGRGGRAARPEVSASPRLPPARPRAPLSLPLPPPPSSPAPSAPRAAPAARSPAPASDSPSRLLRGALSVGIGGTPPRRGSRWPPRQVCGSPGSPPRSPPPPGRAERTSAAPRPRRAALEGARPRLPRPEPRCWGPLPAPRPGRGSRPPRGGRNRISRLPGGGGGRGLGRPAPTCSEVHGAGGRAGRARLLSRRLAEWEGEPRLRRSFNNPIRQAHSQVFFARFRIFFFFGVGHSANFFFFF